MSRLPKRDKFDPVQASAVEKKEVLSSSSSTSFTYDAWGNRTARVTRNRKGEIVSKENRVYDKYGRLAETIAGFGAKVTYAYDSKGRLARQIVDGSPIDYVYTRRGQLAGKYLGGKLNPDAAVVYEYAKDGQIVARTANGVRQTYEYDLKGQLLGVKEGEEYVERYAYDKAGNMLRKTIAGKITTFTFDDANQLVSSTCDGVTTRYEYDAAGRLAKEGNRTYTYGYLDKVTSVKEGANVYTYDYHVDGQLAKANYGKDGSEDFTWDGLALIQRGDERFVNEPHIGGGNPVASSKGTTYFNDMLGTTVGSKSGAKYSAAALTAFGEDLEDGAVRSTPTPSTYTSFYTGKPYVEGLGHAFLMRNYRASLGKWQTADPLGYPDGWNALAYCNNGVTGSVDLWGCQTNPPMPTPEEIAIYKAKNESPDNYENISRMTDDAADRFSETSLSGRARIEISDLDTFKKHIETEKVYGDWVEVISGCEYYWERTVSWTEYDNIYSLKRYDLIIPPGKFELLANDINFITTFSLDIVGQLINKGATTYLYLKDEQRTTIGFKYKLVNSSQPIEHVDKEYFIGLKPE